MAGVAWVKITTDMFDNRKIKHLRRLPDGNNIVLIWVMLLTMAGRCNAGGMIFLTENIPYTPKMLADELDFEENTVILALQALEQFQMIVTDGERFRIAGWEEYQNIEGLEKIREQNRLRKQRQRERQKLLAGDSHGTITGHHATEEEREEEPDREEDKEILTVSKDTVRSTDVQRVVDAWNALGLNTVKDIKPNTKRYTQFRKRVKDYGIDTILEAIRQIPKSSFLNGGGKKGFVITFDWFIAPNNFVKVLEGNYADRQSNLKNTKAGAERMDDLDGIF